MPEGPRTPRPGGAPPLEGEIIPPDPKPRRPAPAPPAPRPAAPAAGSPPARRLPSLLPMIDAFDGVWRKP